MPPAHDVPQWENLPLPRSLPQFQKLFPDNAVCARYLEGARWPKGFKCEHCHEKSEPFRFAARPGVLRCRKCRRDTSLTAGTVMAGTHTPLTIWFWGAYLVSTSTPGFSAVQFQRQVGLSRYETAFQILRKLRAGILTKHWVTTAPNPRRPVSITSIDAGQRGWRLHAVEAPADAKFDDIRRKTALCGLRPRHGWGVDMFIEDRCKRCQRLVGEELPLMAPMTASTR